MADTDETNVWQYTPSFPLAILGTSLYGIAFLWITYLTAIKYRAWYFLCVPVGGLLEVVGYAMRCYSIKAPSSLGPYIVTLSLTVLAPIFFAAGTYLLLGRLARAVLPASRHSLLGVPARLATRLFVGCDILSFLIQCSGSSVASSDEWVGPNAQRGIYILIAGLSSQVLTFVLFLGVFVRFHVLAKQYAREGAPGGWRRLVGAVYASSVLILLRSIYRVAEFADGTTGYSFTHEWLFWVFEALPMLVVMFVFCLVHPNKCLGSAGGKKTALDEEGSGELSEMGQSR